jgi:hypothetical protein
VPLLFSLFEFELLTGEGVTDNLGLVLLLLVVDEIALVRRTEDNLLLPSFLRVSEEYPSSSLPDVSTLTFSFDD